MPAIMVGRNGTARTGPSPERSIKRRYFVRPDSPPPTVRSLRRIARTVFRLLWGETECCPFELLRYFISKLFRSYRFATTIVLITCSARACSNGGSRESTRCTRRVIAVVVVVVRPVNESFHGGTRPLCYRRHIVFLRRHDKKTFRR